MTIVQPNTQSLDATARKGRAVRASACPARLAVFGATGGVGRELIALALQAGYDITALARDPARLDDAQQRVVAGDATDYDAVRRTVTGADVVICALGAPALSRSKVRSDGTRQIVRAMEDEGVKRLICLSVLGAGGTREGLPFFLRYVIFPLYLRRAVAEHETQEAIIRKSGLDWTIVRPPTFTDGAVTGNYAQGFDNDMAGLSLKISRADVADFMLRQLGTDAHVHQSVGISYRK